MRACVIARGVLLLEGKRRVDVPGEAQMIAGLLCVGTDWRPAPWRRVSRGVYTAAKKEGGAD